MSGEHSDDPDDYLNSKTHMVIQGVGIALHLGHLAYEGYKALTGSSEDESSSSENQSDSSDEDDT